MGEEQQQYENLAMVQIISTMEEPMMEKLVL